MKRFLLTAVLILAVIASLTAGTLAAYNQTLGVTGNVHSKTFNFTMAKGFTFSEPVEIVPDSKNAVYLVTVNQNMEIPVNYTVDTTLSGSPELMGRLKKHVYLISVIDGFVEKDGDRFTLGRGIGTDTFAVLIVLEWKNFDDDINNPLDVAASGKDVKLNVSINGVAA